MNPRCEAIGKYVVPLFRSLVAKELINTYNLTQVDAAQRLGTTQAAISQYINSNATKALNNQVIFCLRFRCDGAGETAKRLLTKKSVLMKSRLIFASYARLLLCSQFLLWGFVQANP